MWRHCGNPAGPTLSCVSLLDETTSLAEKSAQLQTFDLIQIMLNPFVQEVNRIGRATIQDASKPMIDYDTLFSCNFGGCPTLLFPSTLLNHATAVHIHATWLNTFEGAAWTWHRIQQHPIDPWTRIAVDIQSSVRGYGTPWHWTDPAPLGISHPEFEAVEFARFALSPEHMIPELQAFCCAWEGSINFQRETGNSDFAEHALQFDDFQEWFTTITNSCRLPEGTNANHAN